MGVSGRYVDFCGRKEGRNGERLFFCSWCVEAIQSQRIDVSRTNRKPVSTPYIYVCSFACFLKTHSLNGKSTKHEEVS